MSSLLDWLSEIVELSRQKYQHVRQKFGSLKAHAKDISKTFFGSKKQQIANNEIQENHKFGNLTNEQVVPVPKENIPTDLEPIAVKDMSENPGPYEDLCSVIREIQIQPTDGLKFAVSKTSQTQQATMVWNVSNDSSNKCSASYSNCFESGIVSQTEIDSTLNIQTSMIAFFQGNSHPNIRFQGQAKSGSWAHTELNGTYFGSDYSLSGAAIDLDIPSKNGILSLQFLRRFKGRLDIGTECMGQFLGNNFEFVGPSVAFRYQGAVKVGSDELFSFIGNNQPLSYDYVAFGSFGRSNYQLYFVQNVGQNFKILSSFEYSPNLSIPGIFTLAYTNKIGKLGATIKSSIDSTKTVAMAYEQQIGGDNNMDKNSCRYAINASVAHSYLANKTVCGFGITLNI